jgi:cytidylate kinase
MATPSSIIVAIDGGAASGKSSSSKILAERFNLLHVDTGSFYRQITSELLRQEVAYSNHAGLETALAGLKLTTQLDRRSAQMLINGQAAGDEIRSQIVNENVSHYAAIPAVRQTLLGYQRGQVAVAQEHGFQGLIMEGRDIGSVIFPEADFRFFLHADPAERAKRRAAEGQTDSIAARDRIDSSRKTSPLTCPDGANDIDSTHLTLDEVVAKMSDSIATQISPA